MDATLGKKKAGIWANISLGLAPSAAPANVLNISISNPIECNSNNQIRGRMQFAWPAAGQKLKPLNPREMAKRSENIL